MEQLGGEDSMGHHSVIITFLILSFMGWYGCVFPTKRLIRQVGLNVKYWPKHYIVPNKKIRRLYDLKKQEIPKWCYYQLLLSYVYIILFVISFLLYFCLNNKLWVMESFMRVWCVITAVDMIYLVANCIFYRI